jgi:hypothetical protein
MANYKSLYTWSDIYKNNKDNPEIQKAVEKLNIDNFYNEFNNLFTYEETMSNGRVLYYPLESYKINKIINLDFFY